MEKSDIKNENIEIVNKGFVYYIVSLIQLPFKIIFFILKFSFKKSKIYVGWYKDYKKHEAKTKYLNKMLNIKRYDDEII